MPAIITNKFRIHNSEQFFESFSEAASNTYYLAIGRPQPYATLTRADGRTENLGTDTNPITPADNNGEEFYSFDDMLAAKKITSSDTSFVVPRVNWTAGTVYDMYRHDYGTRITGTTTNKTSSTGATTLYDASFYVLTADRNVYKVLDNNGGAAVTSGNEPSGTSTSVITTGDGYKYKYMYTLSASEQANFLSTDFMAVTRNADAASTQTDVINASVDGAIDIVEIKSAGAGGTNGTFNNVEIRGDYAKNSGTRAECSVTVTGGVITDVTVTTRGSGYTFGYITLTDIGSSGLSGAELDVIIPPKGGHGANAVEELGGFFVMLNTSLQGTEAASGSVAGDIEAGNDFRKVMLLRDPTSGGSAATANTLRATKAVVFSSYSVSEFTVDEKITGSSTGAVGKVVGWDSTNKILYYIQTRFNDAGLNTDGDMVEFTNADTITGASSSTQGIVSSNASDTVLGITFTNGFNSPELDHDSGDVMYIENRTPIQRATDQTENIKLVIEF